ncbi:DUF3024 domain-containing protein [Nitrospira defluvii]|nr:DUF3024 domain-containing protein [Nitrospira defluvii]
MAISEFEIKKCEKAIEKFMAKHRPPAHIRNELDLASRIENQSVVLFEIRPQWDNPSKKIEHPVAKATYVKAQKLWKVYWQRADLKWHSYTPIPTVKTLEGFLEVIGEDQHACFFG